MRILLPPSEGKTDPHRGTSLELASLSFPELSEPRRLVLDALTTLCTTDPCGACATLGLTSNQSAEVVRNQHLWSAPTAPAWQIYSGVLYGQLDAASLTVAQRTRLAGRVWIASALFGFVGFTDRIPAYRLSSETTLPGIGSLARFWRDSLTPLLLRVDESELIVDLRSGSYVKLGPLPDSMAQRAVATRVLQKMPLGPPKLITHFNKATKGRILRAVAQHPGKLRTLDDLAQLIATLGADVILIPPTRTGQPQQLDIIVTGAS
ncbi:YaaA family protein [Armatimonas sp.]|uniref:YaaA family protein n=1 Tax=Armatimonas sp. TaxID=1872638 RepID=UPI00375264AF